MHDGLLTQGWQGLPWVFIRGIAPDSPRGLQCERSGFYSLTADGFIRLPYEVVHAPGFGIWATEAVQEHLAKVLPRRSLLARAFLETPGVTVGPSGEKVPFERWIDTLPEEIGVRLRRHRPLTEEDFSTNLIALSPDNEILGPCTTGQPFDLRVSEARRPQPAPVRLATIVGLVAATFEDPDRSWPPYATNRQPFDRLIPHSDEVPAQGRDKRIRLQQTVLRLAMVAALPKVLDSLPQSGGPEAVQEACRRLAEIVTEEICPARESSASWATVDGDAVVFTRELLAWPRSVRELAFARAGEPERSGTVGLLQSIARSRLTPDQMAAVMMKLWGISPLDVGEAGRLTVHLSRARDRLRVTWARGDSGVGGDL